jgi:hypothetical protein
MKLKHIVRYQALSVLTMKVTAFWSTTPHISLIFGGTSDLILWHVDPLLGNDHEKGSHETAFLSNGTVNNRRY